MPSSSISRRQFLTVVAGATFLSQLPGTAWAADRPPLDFEFPQDPTLTWFEQTYGALKSDGRRHMGIDLMAPKLSPVYAVSDGVVSRIADSPKAGRYLMLEHNDGWESWYLHLNNDSGGRDNGRAEWGLTVVDGIDEGDLVTAGDHIAFVGDSGNAEGVNSHTHFELHLGTRTVNPWPYLVAGQQRALDQIRAEQVAGIVDEICNPLQGNLSVDAQVCPDDFEYLEPPLEFPRGVSRGSRRAV